MLVVIGGHTRNIGKTSVMAGLISAIPEAHWQAVKITQYGHNVCEAEGGACGCSPSDPLHPYALEEQTAPDGTDSGRYLAAGAARSWWLRTAQGDLGHAIGAFRELIASARNTIVESNSILRFVRPELYIAVLDYSNPDMKDSARQFLDRADALVMVSEQAVPPWRGIPGRWLRKPTFSAGPPSYTAPDLVHMVRQALHSSEKKAFLQ